jgi:hypothetical protein
MAELGRPAADSSYESIVPKPSRLNEVLVGAFLVAMLLMFAYWPLSFVAPVRPATWLAWLILYAVAFPLCFAIWVVIQGALVVLPTRLVWGRPASPALTGARRVSHRILSTIAMILTVTAVLKLRVALGPALSRFFATW